MIFSLVDINNLVFIQVWHTCFAESFIVKSFLHQSQIFLKKLFLSLICKYLFTHTHTHTHTHRVSVGGERAGHFSFPDEHIICTWWDQVFLLRARINPVGHTLWQNKCSTLFKDGNAYCITGLPVRYAKYMPIPLKKKKWQWILMHTYIHRCAHIQCDHLDILAKWLYLLNQNCIVLVRSGLLG